MPLYGLYRNSISFLKVFFISMMLLTGSSQVLAQNTASDLFIVTQKAFEDGFYDVAIRYVNQFLKENPKTERKVQANLLLGQCYFFKAQYLKAFSIFKEFLSYKEYQDVTLFWMGETYLKGSDYKKAEEYYKKVIQQYPKSMYIPQVQYSLGWLFFDTERFDEARKHFKIVMTQYKNHQLKEDSLFKFSETEYKLKEYKSAITFFKKYDIEYPNSQRKPNVYSYIGESYYYLSKFRQAIDYYQRALENSYNETLLSSSDDSLRFTTISNIAWSYLKEKEYIMAEQYFREAETFDHDKNYHWDDIYMGWATLYTETGDYDKALEVYNNLITLFPESSRIKDALLGKGNILYVIQDYKKAITHYKDVIERVIEVSSVSEDFYEKVYFSLAWAELKSGDIDSSVETFLNVKNKTKNRIVKVSALTQIGDAYQDINQLEKAINIYDQVLREFSESPYTDYVQYRQGIALLKNKNIDAAKAAFQMIKSNFPNSQYLKEADYYLAVASFQQHHWIYAKEHLQNFIKNSDDKDDVLVEAYHLLALVDFNMSNYKEALNTFGRIVDDFSEHKLLVQSSQLNIAKCLYKLGNEKEALKKFLKIIKEIPDSEEAQESFLWIADYYLQKEDYGKSISYYREFIDKYPNSDKKDLVYFDLGQIYFLQNKFNKSIAVLKNINKTNREIYTKAKLIMADVFHRGEEYTQAISTYENIIKTSPEFKREASMKIAHIRKRDGDYDKALLSYQMALSSDLYAKQADNAEIQFYIADIYELMNDEDRSVEEYLKIAYLYKYEVAWIIKSYLRIGRIFEDEDQWRDARTIYEKIIPYHTKEVKFAEERIQWIDSNIGKLDK